MGILFFLLSDQTFYQHLRPETRSFLTTPIQTLAFFQHDISFSLALGSCYHCHPIASATYLRPCPLSGLLGSDRHLLKYFPIAYHWGGNVS